MLCLDVTEQGARPPLDREFLRRMWMLVEAEPRQLVSASQVAQQLGLEYDEALRTVERLCESGLVRQVGSGGLLSGMRIRFTHSGFAAAIEKN